MKKALTSTLIAIAFMLPACVRGQSTGAPIIANRGLVPGQTHDISSIEHISMETGSLFLNIPLASLPPGPGGSGFTLGLTYNSDVFDAGAGGPETSQTGGGWNYSYQYVLLQNLVPQPGACSIPVLTIVFPDGSQHPLTALYAPVPTFPTCAYVIGPASYFTADGTSARVDLPGNSPSFVLYLKNGTRVNGSGFLGPTITSSGSRTDSITDRNGNTIHFAYGSNPSSGDPMVTITDQASGSTANRLITLTMASAVEGGNPTDVIVAPGANGSTLTTDVNWSSWTPTVSGGGPDLIYLNGTVCGAGQSPPPNYCDYPVNAEGVTSITLPYLTTNSVQQYFFTYDTQVTNPTGWGQLATLQLPTGPTVSYTYLHHLAEGPAIGGTNFKLSLGFFDAGPTVHNPLTSRTVTYPGESPQLWTYTPWDAYNYTTGAWLGRTSVTVTDPDNGQRIYTDINQNRVNGDQPVYIRSITDPDGDVTDKVLSFFRINFSGVPIPSPAIADVETLAEFHTVQSTQGAMVSSRLYTYDNNGNILTDSEYGFMPVSTYTGWGVNSFGSPAVPSSIPGGLIRQTVNTWNPGAAPQSTSGSVQANDPYGYWNVLDLSGITKLDAVASTTVLDATGVRSFSTFSYDNAVTTGNLLSRLDWDSELSPSVPSSLSTSNAIKTSFTYDAGGNVATTTDANGAVTTNNLTYCGGYAAAGMTQTKTWLSRTFKWLYTWDCGSGLLKNSTDAAGTAMTYGFDNLGRVTSIVEGMSIQRTTSATYTVSSTIQNTPAVAPVQITITKTGNQSGDLSLTEIQTFNTHGTMVTDQKGDTVVARLGPTISGVVTYEAVANPQFAAGSDSTAGWAVTQRDTMGRPFETDYFMGATVPFPWQGSQPGTPNASSTINYSAGYTTKVTDESGRVRLLTADGGGRLATVTEDPANLNYTTQYSYDFGDRLTGVSQSGLGRSFVYSSLGRLTSATNPETGNTNTTGTINYTHDGDGDVLTRTDARQIVTSYGYDDLGRLRTKTYSDGTPQATWCFDGDANPDESVTRRGVGLSWSCTGAPTGNPNMVSRQTMSTTAVSSTLYTQFDELGEVLASQQQTNGGTYPFIYTWYSGLGLLNTQANAATGRTLTWGYDSSARQNSVNGTTSAGTTAYAGPPTTQNTPEFWPSGAFQALNVGNGLMTQTSTYDFRLRPLILAQAGLASAAETLTYTWYPNGNLKTETIANPALTSSVVQTFGYDTVNRLTSATESGNGAASQAFVYDAFGNRCLNSASYNPYPAATAVTSMTTCTGYSNNQWASGTYDAAGNLQTPAGMVSTATATYDAENRVTTMYDTSTSNPVQFPLTYYYDADGRRVVKAWCSTGTTCTAGTAGANVTTFVYDASGEMAAEFGGPAQSANGTEYVFADHLGSTRIMVESGGPTVHCYDYTAFGQEIGAGQSGRGGCYEQLTYPSGVLGSVREKFTGKERDAESGLDYFGARYYASSMGRWMSPDWSAKEDPVPYAKLDNPQSLNLYGYVLNNPLSQKDDDGHEIIYADGLKNGQLVRDSVTAILANPNTSSYLSGYVGPNAPNLIIQSGDLGPPTVTTLPNGQTLTTTVQGNTAPDIQTTQMNNDPPQTTLTGATITIDNNTSKGDTPGVMIHESVHAGEAQKNPAQFNKDAKAERGQPHDSRPQEQRANAVRAANEKQIKQQIKQIEKDRKKDQQ